MTNNLTLHVANRQNPSLARGRILAKDVPCNQACQTTRCRSPGHSTSDRIRYCPGLGKWGTQSHNGKGRHKTAKRRTVLDEKLLRSGAKKVKVNRSNASHTHTHTFTHTNKQTHAHTRTHTQICGRSTPTAACLIIIFCPCLPVCTSVCMYVLELLENG